MIRVLHIGPSLSAVGGVSGVARAILSMHFGDSLVLDYFENTAAPNTKEGIPTKLIRHVRHLLRLKRRVKQLRPRIIHFHTCSGNTFWRTVIDWTCLPRRRRSATVVHLHGGGFESFYLGCSWMGQWWIRQLLTRADAVVVLTEQWQRVLQRIAPRAAVVVVPNGVPIPACVPPLMNRGANIGCIAKLDREKGIRDLIQAFEGIAAEVDGTLRIAGPPGNLGQCIEMHRGRVELPGALDERGRDEFLSKTDVFVLASHAEGLPLVLLEAMAWGRPVVATAVGGIPDLIRHGENGLLVPAKDPAALKDALRTLLNDEQLRRRLGSAGRETVLNRFTLATQKERLTRLYHELISSDSLLNGSISSPADFDIAKAVAAT